MVPERSPFHAGELEAQRRADVRDAASSGGKFIRDYMPDQHREFFAALPFLVVAAGDREGRPWVTIIEGPPGFASSPDPRTLLVAARPHAQDPLESALLPGAAIGILGIDLATRRRNRLNGVIRAAGHGFAVDARQSFGNCPQHIHQRAWRCAEPAPGANAHVSRRLGPDQQARIAAADTLFIGSGYSAGGGRSSDGYDASHRGGPRGFVRVSRDGTLLRLPDYAGNNLLNTIGNLIRDPRVGLLVVDFATGGLLQITGRARIDWTPKDCGDPNARRVIEVTVEKVVDRPAALALRWQDESGEPRPLKVVDIAAKDLLALGAGADARYMLCGPAPFLADLRAGLESRRLPPGHIHLETFGPSTESDKPIAVPTVASAAGGCGRR